MMDWITKIAGSMGPETVFFIVLIFVFFIFLNLSFNRRAITQGPTILTTFGIFGTFVGIAVGLSEFDTSNVREGVPALLSGLKTAFWASVFGVGGALCLKLRVFILGTAEDDDENRETEATVADVVRTLQDLNLSIAGRHEESLLTQLKLLKKSSNAMLAALRKALDEEDADAPTTPGDFDMNDTPSTGFGKRKDFVAPEAVTQ